MKIAGDVIILPMCTKNRNHMMYGSWDTEWDRQTGFFLILGHFLPIHPLLIPKIKILNKINKTPEDIIILHMGTINAQSYVHHGHIWLGTNQMFDSWNIEGDRHNFLSFWTIFCHFTPLPPTNNPRNQNFEKMKKKPRDIIILHMCTINDNHMMYGSWDMECDRQNLTFLEHLLPFYSPPYRPRKSKFSKNEKKPTDIIISHMCTKNHDHMLYCSWDTMRDICNFYFLFGAIFCCFAPPTTQKNPNF